MEEPPADEAALSSYFIFDPYLDSRYESSGDVPDCYGSLRLRFSALNSGILDRFVDWIHVIGALFTPIFATLRANYLALRKRSLDQYQPFKQGCLRSCIHPELFWLLTVEQGVGVFLSRGPEDNVIKGDVS